ncbi:cysteine-rich receptor-like protein kinase 10 isoform X2 [Cryptomeria japonica]|uniref:cysteine-rich receptor-like protein kinase 10 isoform X2 n=1 Tax=Cryptomeria japonica TaxID=3369 RepID=UPI0027DAA2EC|nr:cysteine-rich receptor-like protein kinase 10 isoform X2 [Cryptomeria japonica]
MFLILLLLMIFPSAKCEYRYSTCNNASNYTEGSTYSTNLNLVINDLSLNAPQNSGFNTSSHGQSPNKVYGLLQCVGDVSAAKCSECSSEASNMLRDLCDKAIGGEVWMYDCFLHYHNSNFFQKMDTIFYVLRNDRDVKGNVKGFVSTTSTLLSNLSAQALDPANNGYAVGSAKYSNSHEVYGLVLCLKVLSMEDCKSCLSRAWQSMEQCCSSKQGLQAMSGSCTARYEIYQFFDSSPSTPSPPPVAHGSTKATSEAKSNKSSRRLPMILGITIGLMLICVACFLTMLRKVKSTVPRNPATLEKKNEERRLFTKEQIAFSLEILIEATEDFSDNNKLGEGGFGPVYKGMTTDGKEIAVKKLSARSAQGRKEFMNEVELVANIQHRNLVNLLGCCSEETERMLVYEYMPNKSLDTFLFDPFKRRTLDWQKRFNIIIGITRGLLYLHEDSQLRIIHRDIKSGNILLDDNLNPKIADFGLARLFSDNETEIQSRVAGTYGYMAPEYAMGGQLSVKADVYSFGVLLLEIVSGRKNTDIDISKENQSLGLLEWAWRLFKGGHALKIVDTMLVGNSPEEQVIRCIHIGLLCTQANPDSRPMISSVFTMISSNSVPLPNPTRPAFVSMTSQSPRGRWA